MLQSPIVLSAFLDEASSIKDAKSLDEQLLAGQIAGLKYWTPRFIRIADENKNFSALLNDRDVEHVIEKSKAAGLVIGCLGSALGKSKLTQFDDGTSSRYKSDKEVLLDADRAIYIAARADARLIRGFSFYFDPAQGRERHHIHACDLVGKITERCRAAGLVYALEPEPGLIANDADSMIRLAKDVANPHLVFVSDLANFQVQALNPYEEHRKLVDSGSLGVIHVKDYSVLCPDPVPPAGEKTLRNYCSIERGITGYPRVFEDLASMNDNITPRLAGLGLEGLYVDAEGHARGGGQFGGWSGPDGFGVVMRAITSCLDSCELPYVVRTDDDLAKSSE